MIRHERHEMIAIISCLSFVSVFSVEYKEVQVVLTSGFSFIPISKRFGFKMDQNWPSTSCYQKVSIFQNEPPGRV